eukprot:Sspe_Gene.95211::Locus_67520_Transcript_1_1_Confidence_1.000_Length_2826::g.95211::m.95211
MTANPSDTRAHRSRYRNSRRVGMDHSSTEDGNCFSWAAKEGWSLVRGRGPSILLVPVWSVVIRSTMRCRNVRDASSSSGRPVHASSASDTVPFGKRLELGGRRKDERKLTYLPRPARRGMRPMISCRVYVAWGRIISFPVRCGTEAIVLATTLSRRASPCCMALNTTCVSTSARAALETTRHPSPFLVEWRENRFPFDGWVSSATTRCRVRSVLTSLSDLYRASTHADTYSSQMSHIRSSSPMDGNRSHGTPPGDVKSSARTPCSFRYTRGLNEASLCPREAKNSSCRRRKSRRLCLTATGGNTGS